MEIYFVTIVTRAQGEHPNKPRIPDGGAQPLRGSNSKTTHYLLSYFFFRLNTLKSTAKTPAVDNLRLNTLRGNKTGFLSPKKYDERLRSLYA